MINQYDDKLFSISTDGTAGPYLMVVPDQVTAVKAALDTAKVSYQLDDNSISGGDGSGASVFSFSTGVDVSAIEKVLADA